MHCVSQASHSVCVCVNTHLCMNEGRAGERKTGVSMVGGAGRGVELTALIQLYVTLGK